MEPWLCLIVYSVRFMKTPWILFLALALAGCEPHPVAAERIRVDFNDIALRNSLKVESAVSRSENGFLVVELKVRNTGPRNLPCEWRTTFRDKDGMDLSVSANPWTPVVLDGTATGTLARTAPMPGAEKAEFHLREASPVRR